jgi:type I restriction enzyme, S subunit
MVTDPTSAKWRETTLGQVTDFMSGGTPSKSNRGFWTGPVPWVSAKDMKQFRLEDSEDHISEHAIGRGTRAVPAGTTLILVRGMTLLNDVPICVVGLDATFNQDIKALRPKPGVAPEFLPYLLLGNKARIHGLVDLAGHGTGRLNTQELTSLKVWLPPVNEQRAIANILGTLDDKIEMNRRMNETLEEMVSAYFESAFKCETEETSDDKSVPLADLLEVNPVRVGKRGEDAPYLDMASVPTNGARALDVQRRPAGSGAKFINGDTLVARITPCLENGKTCFVDFLKDDEIGWGSTEFIVLRPRPPQPLAFAYFLARTDSFRSHLISNMTGTSGRQRVPADCFRSLRCTLPQASDRTRFDQLASLHLAKMKANDAESKSLASIRDTLLPKLISGAIRVKDAEMATERALG